MKSAVIRTEVALYCGFRWLVSASWVLYVVGEKAMSKVICVCDKSTSNREVFAGRVVLAVAHGAEQRAAYIFRVFQKLTTLTM